MLAQLTRFWWVVALRGVLAILFGILALVWPVLTLQILVLFFGAYALVDGVIDVFMAIAHRAGHDRWWALLLEGLVGIGAGILVLAFPGLAGLVLLYVIAIWAILTGILEIVAAVRLREEIENEWLLILSGIASLVLGILILIYPTAGAITIAWLIGAYAILFGIVLLSLGLLLRKRGLQEKESAQAV